MERIRDVADRRAAGTELAREKVEDLLNQGLSTLTVSPESFRNGDQAISHGGSGSIGPLQSGA